MHLIPLVRKRKRWNSWVFQHLRLPNRVTFSACRALKEIYKKLQQARSVIRHLSDWQVLGERRQSIGSRVIIVPHVHRFDLSFWPVTGPVLHVEPGA